MAKAYIRANVINTNGLEFVKAGPHALKGESTATASSLVLSDEVKDTLNLSEKAVAAWAEKHAGDEAPVPLVRVKFHAPNRRGALRLYDLLFVVRGSEVMPFRANL